MAMDFQHLAHLNSEARKALANLRLIEKERDRLIGDTRKLADSLKREQIVLALGQLPIEGLRDVTDIRIPLEALRRNGITTVGQIFASTTSYIGSLNGISPATASELKELVDRMAQAISGTLRTKVDFDSESRETLGVLDNLGKLDVITAFDRDASDSRDLIAQTLESNLPQLAPTSSKIKWFFTGKQKKNLALQAAAAIEEVTESLANSVVIDRASQLKLELAKPKASTEVLKQEYQRRASDYLAILENTVEEIPAFESEYGDYDEELVARILARDFDARLLNATLRKYQIFGIKFSLLQKRVIIGDEMGLGKTMQALGVLTQVHKEGGSRFLIVCPASVIVNWEREIQSRTSLKSMRIHGADQEMHLKHWMEEGGIGLTTFDTLKNFGIEGPVLAALQIDLVVVDEAHFAKNLYTARSREISRWIKDRQRVIFLSGTPMENRVSEFMGLATMINSDLANTLDMAVLAAGTEPFKKAVAPIYLRRNVAQVLAELPALIEVEDHCSWEGVDMAFYKSMVERGNFMGMRRAAFQALPDMRTSKMERLLDLVEDATNNSQKVIVFSFFTSVIWKVAKELGDRALEPITGGVTPKRRQEIVDQFTNLVEPKVLIGQVQAAGTGLNIQSASVIILCEPQIKPTLETQAIARAHRMGQVRTVQVHRLVVPNSVDIKMMDMLYRKTLEFDAYARDSHLANIAGDQVDEPERNIAKAIVMSERKRLELDTSAPLEIEAPEEL